MFRKRHIVASWLALLLTCPGGRPLEAQLLFRAGEPYVNYAREGYWPYETVLYGKDRRPQFDNLGQFVMSGTKVFELQQFHSIAPEPGSLISKPRLYQDYLNRLIIAEDGYKGVETRLMIGDRIRTKFTPMTLDLAAMNGIRFDSRSQRVSLILVGSRVDRPIFEAFGNADQSAHGRQYATSRPSRAAYLLGGDLRAQWTQLDVGVSWVNQFRTDSFREIGESSLTGSLPATIHPPEWLVVRIADQDPEDKAGVRVGRISVLINGRELVHSRGQYDKLSPDAMILTVTAHPDRTIIPPVITDSSGRLDINAAHVEPTAQGFYETEGKGSLLFWFRVPAFITEGPDSLVVDMAQVDVDVAGDYVVELSEVFNGLSTNPATYFYTAARARGRPSDLTDFRRVRVRYGRQTARTLASVHMNLDFKGYLLHAEYVRNFDHRAYPALTGSRSGQFRSQSPAWFVVGRRDWDRFSLGGEIFGIDEDYSTTLSVQDDSYASSLAVFEYPRNIHEPRLPTRIGPNLADGTYTLEFPTVDDNDDKDQYPDVYYLRKTTNVITGGRYLMDPDGIFPGLDADQNGRPDINENVNRVPDYYEPFLLYEVSPDAYEYGEDMNNNAVIDVREDDQKADLPYDPDRRGGHVFGIFRPRKGMAVTFGYHKTNAASAGTQAEMLYGRWEYERRLPFLAEIYAAERLKRVRDEIRDDVFGVGRNPIYFEPDIIPLVRLTQEELLNPLGGAVLLPDPLLMRDSWVNTTYARVRYIRVPKLNLEMSFKYDRNFQQSTAVQPDNSVSDLAVVVKADYEWNPWKQLRVIPQAKWLRQRLDDDERRVLEINERYFYPILRLEYPVSTRTTVKLGAQGFPFLKSTFRSEVIPGSNFDSEVYVAMVSNTSFYVGYQLNINAGFERRTRTFSDRSRSDQDVDYSRIFLRAIAGLRPAF